MYIGHLPVTANQWQQPSVFVVYLRTTLCAYIFICFFGYIFHNFQCIKIIWVCVRLVCLLPRVYMRPPPHPPSGFTVRSWTQPCLYIMHIYIDAPFPHKHFIAFDNATHCFIILLELYFKVKHSMIRCPTSIFGCHAWYMSRLTDFRKIYF